MPGKGKHNISLDKVFKRVDSKEETQEDDIDQEVEELNIEELIKNHPEYWELIYELEEFTQYDLGYKGKGLIEKDQSKNLQLFQSIREFLNTNPTISKEQDMALKEAARSSLFGKNDPWYTNKDALLGEDKLNHWNTLSTKELKRILREVSFGRHGEQIKKTLKSQGGLEGKYLFSFSLSGYSTLLQDKVTEEIISSGQEIEKVDDDFILQTIKPAIKSSLEETSKKINQYREAIENSSKSSKEEVRESLQNLLRELFGRDLNLREDTFLEDAKQYQLHQLLKEQGKLDLLPEKEVNNIKYNYIERLNQAIGIEKEDLVAAFIKAG